MTTRLGGAWIWPPVQRVRIDQLGATPSRHCFTLRAMPQALVESVREAGVTSPLLVCHEDAAIAVVAGWMRLRAARQTGGTELPCRILEDWSAVDLATASLLDNAGHRQFNAAEQALAAAALSEYYPASEIVRRFLPLLGLRPATEHLERLLLIAALPREALEAMAHGRLSAEAAVDVVKLPQGSRDSVLAVLAQPGMTASLQREVARFFLELWRRDAVSPDQIVADEGWLGSTPQQVGAARIEPPARPGARFAGLYETPVTAAGENAPQAWARCVRDRLRGLRYPMLCEAEREEAQRIDALELPPNARIVHDSGFESPTRTLEARFRSADELRVTLQRLGEADRRGLVDRFFENTPGG